jgi:hypothetical protein
MTQCLHRAYLTATTAQGWDAIFNSSFRDNRYSGARLCSHWPSLRTRRCQLLMRESVTTSPENKKRFRLYAASGNQPDRLTQPKGCCELRPRLSAYTKPWYTSHMLRVENQPDRLTQSKDCCELRPSLSAYTETQYQRQSTEYSSA